MRAFANSQGWVYRANNNFSDYGTVIYNGNVYKDIEMEVRLKPARYKKYPYLDTFKRYIPESGVLYNDDDYEKPGIIISRTDGLYQKTHHKPGLIDRIRSRFIKVPLIESVRFTDL